MSCRKCKYQEEGKWDGAASIDHDPGCEKNRKAIWEATVDGGTWAAVVLRTTESQGELIVTKINDGEVILSERVGLMFGAMFGPDVDDVRMWQHMAVEAVDHYNAHHKETHETEA